MDKFDKIFWKGRVVSVQPRIRLTRSFDQRSHNYMGYALRITGTIEGEDREFDNSGDSILNRYNNSGDSILNRYKDTYIPLSTKISMVSPEF